jgi:glycosyltransferase involved in cell wall biosynthesis
MPRTARALRVLLLSPALPPAASGNARQAARLKKHLGRCHVKVRLAAADAPPGVLLRVACRFRPDLVWGLHLFKSGPAAARLAKPLGIAYGLTVTGTDVNEMLRGATAGQRTAVRAAASLVIPDESFRAPLRRGLRAGHGRPPDIFRIPPAFEIAAGVRAARGKRGPVILWLGGLRAVKDPGWALAAFARVREKIPAARFQFAGPLLERRAAAPVLRAARDPASGVSYLGERSWGSAQRQIARAAAVTNTSRSEALPHALGEALRLGTPVIARAIPGNRPLLRPHGPGIPVATPAAWGRAVLRLLRHPRSRAPHAGARGAPAREARAYAGLFRAVIAAKRQGTVKR